MLVFFLISFSECNNNSVQVFEWLRALNLPEFTIKNWESSKRGLANAHEKYCDLKDPLKKEISDIVYKDINSKFTNLLIDYGYLDETVWSGRQPTYYIEVKTTRREGNATFFVSQSQYDTMKGMMLPDNGTKGEIYLLARVFRLGQADMGLTLYLDPARLRERKELVFLTDTFQVKPSHY